MRTSLNISTVHFRKLNRTVFGEAYRDLSTGSPYRFEIGRVRKIVPDLYRESVAINAI